MADRMDELLSAIGREANESVDFEAAFARVLAQAQARETAKASPPKTARKTWSWARALPMAAGVVVLLGAAALLSRGGLMNGLLSGAGEPQAAAPELAMSTMDSTQAPAPAAFAAPAQDVPAQDAPADAGGALGQSRIMDSAFYGAAVITVPAAGTGCTGTPKASADAQALPEEALRNGSHDAYDTEGGICRIGQTARTDAIEKLAALGYTACNSSDAHVDQLASLQIGEACIAASGEIGVWNTGGGFLTLWNPALGQMEIYELFLAAL